MAELKINCPKCGHEIALSEALKGQFTEELSAQIQDKTQKEYKVQLNEELDKIQLKMISEKEKIKDQLNDEYSLELLDLKAQVKEKNESLEKSQQRELEFRKQQRELEEKQKNLELEITKKVDEERILIEQKITDEFTKAHYLKDLEKEKKLIDASKQIDELKRKLEQGSQQTQGEAFELELEELLHNNFQDDEIEPVAKGVGGADIIQRVRTKRGEICGSILWEFKNTKNWSDGWLNKLKDDQRNAKAEIAILASVALPKGIKNFGIIEGIWVTDLPFAIGLALALRLGLIQIANTKLATVGKDEKVELLYDYLLGVQFKQRIQVIVETYGNLKGELDQEKRAMEKIWSKREIQLEKVSRQLGGLWGELGGILGTALPKIDQLELPEPDNV